MTNEFNTNNAIAELREIESNYTKKCEAEFLLSKTSSNEASDKSGALLIKNARMEAKKRELAVKLPKPVRSALITENNVFPIWQGQKPVFLPMLFSILGLEMILFPILFVILVAVGADSLSIILGTLNLGLVIFWYVQSEKVGKCLTSYDALNSWKKSMKGKPINEGDAEFIENCKKYDREVEEYVIKFAEAKAEAKKELEQFKNDENKLYEEKVSKITEKYEKERKEISQKLESLDIKISSYTLIDKSLFYLSGKIARVLEMGRADSLKEAINIALDDERKEEEEKQRRREAEEMAEIAKEEADRRVRLEEHQAEELRRHNREMEYQAEKQAKAEAEFRKAQLENEKNAALMRARAQCNSCYKRDKCLLTGHPPIPCNSYYRR